MHVDSDAAINLDAAVTMKKKKIIGKVLPNCVGRPLRIVNPEFTNAVVGGGTLLIRLVAKMETAGLGLRVHAFTNP